MDKFLLHPEHYSTKKIGWVDRGWYAVTEFERTSSANFKLTAELAQTYPGFTPLMDERNVLIYRNLYREQHLPELLDMIKSIKKWKGARLYIKGERVPFDMLGHGMHCYIRTVLKQPKSSNRSEACHIFPSEPSSFQGCIGCRRSSVRMAWNSAIQTDSPLWFTFGFLDRHQVYHIYKDDLESAVIGELIEYHYCPLLDLEAIRTFVKGLPERIDPRKDREWRYHRNNGQEKSDALPHLPHHSRADRIPDILPVSHDAYKAYLRRKNIL